MLINSKLFSKNYTKENNIKTKGYRKGQFISDFFDNEYYVGVIEGGEVSVYCISSDGVEVNMTVLSRGDVFGISNIFEKESLDTVLKCKSDVKVVFYPKSCFIEMLKNDIDVALEYLSYCNKKIQFLLKKIEFLNIQSSKNKIIEYLLQRNDDDNIVWLDCSKEELSKRLGLSRASLYRELQFLQSEDCLHFNTQRIQIRDKEKLIKILNQL